MNFTVTIGVPDSLIADVATEAARKLFSPPDYGDRKGGAGYVLIAAAVRDAVLSLDMRPLAEEAAQRLAPGIVEEVVEQHLRKMVRDTVKQATKEGTLL